MVLFHHPDDHDSVRQFKEVVQSELMAETCELYGQNDGNISVVINSWCELCVR